LNPGSLILVACMMCSMFSLAGVLSCNSELEKKYKTDEERVDAIENGDATCTSMYIVGMINCLMCIFVILKLFRVF